MCQRFIPRSRYPAVPDYVDVAFKAAKTAAYNTNTQLFYNDFGAEQMGKPKSEVVRSQTTAVAYDSWVLSERLLVMTGLPNGQVNG